MGKQFTAAAVLLLVEDGRLSLDDPITKHFPDAPAAWGAIRVRHLLSHTSGIADYDEAAVDFRRDYTEDEIVHALYAMPLQFEPGAEWNYSNSGYVLLGALVSRLTGPGFNTTGDGALYLTVLDLARWDAALRAGTILSAESRHAMWTPTVLADGDTVAYGFGWDVTRAPGPPGVGHGGAWQGFKAYIQRFDEPAVTVALLTNGGHANPEKIMRAVARTRDARLQAEPVTVADVPAGALAAFAGEYRLPAGDTVHVRADGGALVLEGLGPEPLRFQPIGGDAFATDESGLRARFRRAGDGRVTQAWLGPPGTPTMRLRRVP